ncbi:unnamed protein product, partial [Effrenium voratum]
VRTDHSQKRHGEEFGWPSAASKSFKDIGGYTTRYGVTLGTSLKLIKCKENLRGIFVKPGNHVNDEDR